MDFRCRKIEGNYRNKNRGRPRIKNTEKEIHDKTKKDNLRCKGKNLLMKSNYLILFY